MDGVMNPREEALLHICEQYSVDILYANGSRARETKDWLGQKIAELAPGPSDLDVGVKPSAGKKFSAREKAQLAVALEDLFGVERTDLVFLHEAEPFLALNVIRGERLYARDSFLADEYDLYVLHQAADLEHWEKERLSMLLEGKE